MDAPGSGFRIDLPQFQGTVEELLEQAHGGKVDLREVSLTDIVDAYVGGLSGEIDLDAATEFLWTAAALIEMKSRALLPPKPAPDETLVVEDESDLAARLEEQIAEYRAFKEAAAALAALEAVQQKVFTRPPADVAPDDLPLVGITVEDLFSAFRRVLERAEDVVAEIPAEGVTVGQQMRTVLRAVRAFPHGLAFERLFDPKASRLVVIVTFLALLELMKRRSVRVEQEKPFSPILVFATAGEDAEP
jgi:segregation and condensation protein A